MEFNDTALKRKLQQRVLRLSKKSERSEKDRGVGRRLKHEMFPHPEDKWTDVGIFEYRRSATEHTAM